MNPLRIIAQPFAQEHERWLLWVPAGLGAGIVIYFNLPFEPPLWALAATPLLALAAWLGRAHIGLLMPLTAALTLALGFNAAQIETLYSAAPMMDRQIGPVPVTGRLMVTEMMPDGVRLTLKDPEIGRLPPERTPYQIRIRMKDKNLTDMPEPGSRINIWAQVGPFSEPVAPHAYDFRRQSFFLRLGGMGWSRSAIDVVDPTPPSSLIDTINLAFERARRALTLHVYDKLSGDKAAMTAALLNGEQNSISKDVMQNMRVSGLAHLLSISGIHVSMMGLLVYFPLRAILALIPWVALRFPIKKWAAGAAIISTALYMLLVGPQAPTLRSTLMTGIVMFAIIADRRALSMRLVALAASLVMLMQPDGVMGPSFEMSFAAVLCMVAAFEKTADRALAQAHNFSLLSWLHFLWKHAGGIILTSLVATAATTPFSIYHFQTFSFYGVVANMVAIPLTSFWVMPCILMAYITAPFGADGIFITGAGWGVEWLIRIANHIAAWPLALLHLPAMPAIALLAIVGGGLWLCLWRQRWRFLGLLPILVGAFYPLYTTQPDFFVTADGKQWAARLDDGRLAVANLDREAFVVEQWQKRLGNPETVDSLALPPEDKQLRCDDQGCVYHRGNDVLAMPSLEAAALEDCERASIIVAPFLIRDCAAQVVIDDPALWHHGAHTISFDSGTPHIEYVRERRGQRPWSPGYKIRKDIDE
ncbi:MAG: ComEC/Rec2 family competence protein [Alphaproteobacteria bacterium]|nr:ComEC/Rec2 family competence protein [Alphaproteobacteria bacterium]